MSFDENPYAPPKSEGVEDAYYLDQHSGPWCDGNLLVARKGVDLSSRCLKCGAPTKGIEDRFTRTIYWHRPIWILLFLVSWPLYLIAYYMIRWQARVTVGLCPLHRGRRTRAIALGWLGALLGIGLIVAGAGLEGQDGPNYAVISVAAGALLLLAAIIGGVFGARVLVPVRINEHYVWLSKVSPDYLADLPDWNQ